jgi:Tol biopolymer transport system component
VLVARTLGAAYQEWLPRRWLRVCGSAAVIVVAAVAMTFVPIVAASFPGANGAFAVELDGCEHTPYIRLFSAKGKDLGAATPPGCSTARERPLFDWSPDGRRILMGQFGRYGSPPYHVVTVAPDGTDRHRLRLPRGARDASFAPDGRHVAFMHRGSIWTAASGGTDLHRLRSMLRCDLEVRDCVDFQRPRWSPNGKLIAFESHSSGGGSGVPPEIEEGIWLMSARTGKLVRRIASGGYDVDWSPNSRQLVYRTEFEQQGTGDASGGDIWIVSANGQDSRTLISRRRRAETSPTWSPDGRWVAWISLRLGADSDDFEINASLWRVGLHGGQPRKLTRLRSPDAYEGEFLLPKLAWQALPKP